MVHKLKKFIKIILIAILWLGIWEIISLIIGKPLLFPSPIDVLLRLCELIITKEFILSAFLSLARIASGILISIIAGSLIAIICSLSKVIYDFFYPFVTIIKSTPVASFIILIWIFTDSNITPIIISALMVFPIVFANVYQGIKNIDKDLIEVAKIYKLPFKRKFASLYVPSVIPYFSSALLSSIGLGWKAGIAAEVLCTPLKSIGRAIFEAKTYFEYVDLFAWTIMVIILSLVFEILFTNILKRILNKFISNFGGKNGN